MEMEGSNSSTPARAPPRSPLNVDEEYNRALRSKSFLDLWANAHRHLRRAFSSSNHDDAVDQSFTVLDDFVLEPSPDALLAPGRGGCLLLPRRKRRVDSLLIEYFDVTQEACEACSTLLAAIGAARRHHLTLRRLLSLMEKENNSSDGGSADARDALAEHILLDNPLSAGRLSEFHDVHERCGPLATRLAAAQRRLRRLARAVRIARGTAAAASLAAVVAAVVFAAHAVVGIGAAAATVPATAVRRAVEKVSGERHYARAGATVDAAARGAYIVGRDMDTMSRMVRRAHDELEHGRDVARIAVRAHGERPLMQEVAKEEAECEADLRAQLQELEEHVCLCLVTINRSRRMVAHQITTTDA